MNAAQKIAARLDGTAKMQTYPANRGAGSVPDIAASHRAKLEARVAAFSAGRKPDASGFLDVTPPDPEAEAKAAEAARAEAESVKARAEAEAKANRGKSDKG